MKTDIQMEVINFFRVLRIDNKLSQAGLADELEISYGLIGNIESSKFPHKYTITQLHKMMVYFDIPFEQLFLEDDELDMSKRKVIDLLMSKIIEYDR